MGKNDLWIAAIASVLKAVILTTDADFDHLHPSIVRAERIRVDTLTNHDGGAEP
jgi:predicted nuclease of predicted toxin-antitoxin system